jgi:hypothetical protein
MDKKSKLVLGQVYFLGSFFLCSIFGIFLFYIKFGRLPPSSLSARSHGELTFIMLVSLLFVIGIKFLIKWFSNKNLN